MELRIYFLILAVLVSFNRYVVALSCVENNILNNTQIQSCHPNDRYCYVSYILYLSFLILFHFKQLNFISKKLYEMECTTYTCSDTNTNNNGFSGGHSIKKRETCSYCYEYVSERGCANICHTGQLRVITGHRVVCCQSDYCNSSSKLFKSIFLILAHIFFFIYRIVS